jgi:alpha-D-ribose 1-methylphosphonate 5-triphosphate synthase subunit PhnH
MSFPEPSRGGTGFADPGRDAQSVFRTVMMALAEPGIVRPLDKRLVDALDAPAPLLAATAAILLALADYETPIWLDAPLGTPEISQYLTFHTGAASAATKGDARFAVFADAVDLSGFDDFAIGSLDYPDRSATLIVQVMSLTHGPAWTVTGPGIATICTVHISPIHHLLSAYLQANRRLFPRGVDLIFTDGTSVLGLPRSTVVSEG